MLIDQHGYVKNAAQGLRLADERARCRIQPTNSYVSSYAKNGPYKYNPAKARRS